MQWFDRSAIQPNHFESDYGMATPFLMKIWYWVLGARYSSFSSDHEQEHEHERE